MSKGADWLDDLVAGARAGGEMVDSGRFRLDWTRALDKIKRFQLADPHCYVLEIIQGAIARGAPRVEVTITADDVFIAFSGARLSGEELAGVFDSLFSRESELALNRQLALGINAALALEPAFVRVDSGDGTTAHRLQLSGYDDLTVTALPSNKVIDGIRVQVRDGVNWRLVGDIFRGRSNGAAVMQLIRDHCQFAPVPIVVNGTNVATGLGVAAVAEQRFSGDVSGGLILPASPRRGPNIAVCMNGVQIVRLDAEVATWPRDLCVGGYVDDPGLARNASHSDVHRDTRFTALVATLERHVRALLEQYVRIRLIDGDRGDLNDRDRYYLTHAAQVLLGTHKGGRARKTSLSAAQEALLDLPDVVELAVERPARCALRPVWDAFQQTGVVDAASRRHSIPLDALPPGMYPVLGPSWVIDGVFKGAVQHVDPLLDAAERGQRRRRTREARRRSPELMDHEAFVQVPVDGPYRIRGEFGLTARIERSITELVDRDGRLPDGGGPPGSALVIFMRDGVVLGARWITTPVYLGVAVLESPGFAPNVMWSDVVTNKAVEAVSHILDAAVPRLVEALATRYETLPPPVSMHDVGAYSPRSGRDAQALRSIARRWPADGLVVHVRTQIDEVLASRAITPAEAPSLSAWPIFHTVTGRAVTLDQIAGEVAVAGLGVVRPDDWSVATAVAWGAPDAPILNLTARQQSGLERQLGRTFAPGDAQVAAAREDQQRRAAMAARRKIFMPRADLQQMPALKASDFEVTIDVTVPGGRGQAGIPRLGVTTSWLRPICDGLPLLDQKLDSSFPVHAVVVSDRITANDAFEDPITDAGYRAVVEAVLAMQPALIGAFAAKPAAQTPGGEELLWQYLHDVEVPRRNPLSGVPGPVASHPLLRAVDGRRISLRDLAAQAKHREFRYVTTEPPGPHTSRPPIVVCSLKQRQTIARLTGLRGRNVAEELREELAALARRRRPKRPAVLREPTLLTVALTGADLDGEVGIPAAIAEENGDGGWVDVLIDGVPLERRLADVGGLPVIAVISSPQLQADKAWKHVVRDQAWTRAVEALHRAAHTLVRRGCELASDGAGDVDGTALRIALRRMAAACFHDRPDAPLTASSTLERALADAPVWESVDGRDALSLRDISAHWRRTDRVWIVPVATEPLVVDRLVVRGGAITRAALQQIYGAGVRDGTKVLARDQAASGRRATAPALDTRLVGLTKPSEVTASGGPGGLAIRGQVTAAIDYARAARGIDTVIGIEGRRLGKHVFAHRLRGAAWLDCTGLQVDADWTAPSDRVQLAWIHEHVATALWACVAAAVRAGTTEDDVHRRLLFIDALGEVLDGGGPAELRAPLMAAPLFRTVQGTLLSGDELCARSDAGEAVHAVSDQLDAGEPPDGRLIIRGGERALDALQLLLGSSVIRDDDRWRRETETLAAQREFQRRPRVDPITVTAVTDEELLWRGSLDQAGIEGELAIPAVPGRGIELHVFVDNRHISTHERPAICRAIVAVQSDQLVPTAYYDGIVRDSNLTALERRVRDAVWDAITQRAASPSPAAWTVLIHALIAARRSSDTAPAFRRMRDTLEQAPLFVDVRDRSWSLRTLQSAVPPDEAVRYVSADTAPLVDAPDGVVLVLDHTMRESVRRLMRLDNVGDHYRGRARAPRRREAVARAKRRTRPAADTRHIHLLSRLKALLREAGGRHFNRSVVNPMRLESRGGRRDLVRLDSGVVVVNRDHPMWKSVVAVEPADAPDALRHLAVAVISCLGDQRGLYDAASAVTILERLAVT